MYNPQLETFIHVADVGSFNKAAEELYITPTAVIKQINLLEKNLELQLFKRTHRGLILTESGKSFYQDAKYVIQYCKDSVVRAKNAAHESDNVIRIGTSPMTPGQFLMELWPKIHKICPDVKFELIPYENTPENAREILKNLGKNIDIVAGLFDPLFLEKRQCAALELYKEPIQCAVSLHHPFAAKEQLTVEDLYGENLMLIESGWNHHLDILRNELKQNHPQINIVDFDFFSMKVFNECEKSDDIIMTVEYWKNIHPLLKTIPIKWNYIIPFGILHSPNPSESVQKFLNAVRQVLGITNQIK